MKEKVVDFFKSKFFFAAALNLIIAVIIVFPTSFSYDTVDDFYNSLYICHYHYYYSSDINYILAVIIGSVQYITDGINCYVFGMFGLSYAAFASVTYVLADKFGKPKAFVFTLIINSLFAFDHYSDVSSTKTSALLLAAGFLLVINAVRNKRYNLPFWLGAAEAVLGSFYCFEYFFAALLFAVMFFVGDMIAKRKYKIRFRKFFWYFRPFLLCFIFVALAVVGLNRYSYAVNTSSQEAADYYEYCQLTDSINNFPYPGYKDYEQEFAEVGITSESEYELLKNGYYDESTGLNNQALRLVYEIQLENSSKTVITELGSIFSDIGADFAAFNTTSVTLVFLVLAAAVFAILHKKRFIFFPLLYAAAAIVCGVGIRYFLNGSSYTTYGVWLLTAVFLLYSFDFEHMRGFVGNCRIFSSGKIRLCLSLAAVPVVCGASVFAYALNLKPVETKNRPSGLYLEMSKHPENYYVIDPVTFEEYIKYCDNYIHPMWGISGSFFDNIDTFGYFDRSIQRHARGLSASVYEAVIDNRYVYVIDNTITYKKENYFTSHYADESEYITYVQSGENSGYKLYKVVSSQSGD